MNEKQSPLLFSMLGIKVGLIQILLRALTAFGTLGHISTPLCPWCRSIFAGNTTRRLGMLKSLILGNRP